MRPRREDGWLVVPCDASPFATVELSIGGGEWVPAFRSRRGTRRTAMARLDGTGVVLLRVDGHATNLGTI